ncbi:GntR family transcriptional regulator [Aquipuribacter nitratireducens]|uniref:GntR family transcriptional regulator n=1 Tax=Aquipuribacter nitratireducens TaxID=650104 RepID=A0ABW0GR73_9MICO
MGAASARVADHLRTAIPDGELGPGDRVRQEDVAARLGAGRPPVREALRLLEAEGLVRHERHKGARVPRLSLAEVVVMYRMREQVEPRGCGTRPSTSTARTSGAGVPAGWVELEQHAELVDPSAAPP